MSDLLYHFVLSIHPLLKEIFVFQSWQYSCRFRQMVDGKQETFLTDENRAVNLGEVGSGYFSTKLALVLQLVLFKILEMLAQSCELACVSTSFEWNNCNTGCSSTQQLVQNKHKEGSDQVQFSFQHPCRKHTIFLPLFPPFCYHNLFLLLLYIG